MNQVQVKSQVGLTFASALAGVPAAGPRHHHGRRGPRPGDRRDLPPRRPDGALRALDDPHQRRTLGRDPVAGHGDRAVPAGLLAARARGAAIGAQALHPLQGAVRGHRGDRGGARARPWARPSIAPRVACNAGGWAIAAGSASSRSSGSRPVSPVSSRSGPRWTSSARPPARRE